MPDTHKFVPRWDKQEKAYYCFECGILKRIHEVTGINQTLLIERMKWNLSEALLANEQLNELRKRDLALIAELKNQLQLEVKRHDLCIWL